MKVNYSCYKGFWVGNDIVHERELSDKECNMLIKQGGYGVRNVYGFDTDDKTCFWYVIKDSFGGMDELSSNTRNKVRKSLKRNEVQRITKEVMVKEGYRVYRQAMEGYKIKSDLKSYDEFRAWIVGNPDTTDYWGVFDKENHSLIAFSINDIAGTYCNYSTLKAMPSYLRSNYPYYGLIYTMNQYYLADMGLHFVNDGARSITNHSNIQPFLIEKFKFRKAYCRIKLYYKPWFGD